MSEGLPITETIERPREDEFGQVFTYAVTGDATVHKVWVDNTSPYGGIWLESNDGSLVVIPDRMRKLLAKRVRDATFR